MPSPTRQTTSISLSPSLPDTLHAALPPNWQLSPGFYLNSRSAHVLELPHRNQPFFRCHQDRIISILSSDSLHRALHSSRLPKVSLHGGLPFRQALFLPPPSPRPTTPSTVRAKGSAPSSQRIADPMLREASFPSLPPLPPPHTSPTSLPPPPIPPTLQAVFNKRKNALFRRAAELSTMCDAEVAVIVFTPDGELSQFSTGAMEAILRRYGRSCTESHEAQTRETMSKRAAEGGAGGRGAAKRRATGEEGKGDKSTADAMLAMQDLPPVGAVGGSEADLDQTFDKLIEERAKRAQAAAAAAPATAGGLGSPTKAAGAAGGPTSAIDSLAAALAGVPEPAAAPETTAVKVEDAEAQKAQQGAVKQEDPMDTDAVAPAEPGGGNMGGGGVASPGGRATVFNPVDTPTVAPSPPAQGSVDAPAMLGVAAAGAQPGAGGGAGGEGA